MTAESALLALAKVERSRGPLRYQRSLFFLGGPEVLHAVVDVVPHVVSSHVSVGL